VAPQRGAAVRRVIAMAMAMDIPDTRTESQSTAKPLLGLSTKYHVVRR
jgi:hypothetical protein